MSQTKSVDIQGFRYTIISIRESSGAANYVSLPTFGTGVFEILIATIRPVSSTGLGVSNAAILLNWKDSGVDYYSYLKSGFVAQHHRLFLSNQIVFGPITLMGWRQNIDMPIIFEVTYRRIA